MAKELKYVKTFEQYSDNQTETDQLNEGLKDFVKKIAGKVKDFIQKKSEEIKTTLLKSIPIEKIKVIYEEIKNKFDISDDEIKKAYEANDLTLIVKKLQSKIPKESLEVANEEYGTGDSIDIKRKKTKSFLINLGVNASLAGVIAYAIIIIIPYLITFGLSTQIVAGGSASPEITATIIGAISVILMLFWNIVVKHELKRQKVM